MPPRVKRTYSKNVKKALSNSSDKEKEPEHDKENKEKCKLDLEAKQLNDFNTLLKSPLKEKLNLKPLSFWHQKLKDLEPESSFKKPKKRGLYDFSGTDTEESGSPHKRKKKVKQKRGPKKIARKQPVIKNPIEKSTGKRLVRKIKEVHSQSLFKEQFVLKKEREKLADTGKKFTFSTGMPSLGITSTPAVNKDNLVGASNFLFLSPIISEETDNEKAPQCVTPKKTAIPDTPVILETPKLPERRVSYRRVLRNGKVL